MKKIIILPVLALLVFVSCKKSSSSPSSGGSFTATIDGVNESFNDIVVAKDSAFSGGFTMYFGGGNGTTATSDAMSLAIDGPQAVAAGTYSISSTGTTTDLPGLAYSQGGGTNLYSDDPSGVNPLSVTITSITSTNVQGTFSGVLILYSGTSSTKTKTITNGKFNVNFK